MAKLCGQDNPSEIADWVKNRSSQLHEWLKLKRKTMPHHSTYRRITAEVVDVEELEQLVDNTRFSATNQRVGNRSGWRSMERCCVERWMISKEEPIC